MLITELKERDAILPFIKGKTAIICCEGCREVHFPEAEAAGLCKELLDNGSAAVAVVTDYICNPEHLLLQLKKHKDTVDSADTLLVFSCGVGVQTVAANFEGKKALAACDTYPLPGFQGVTPLEYDCDQCGECYLNSTGGICPITACSKSLVNGQCGGAKNGHCEVDSEMECGWERIYRRLEKLGRLSTLRYDVKVRNYAADLIKDTNEQESK
jgi:electron transport complex protein RnfC